MQVSTKYFYWYPKEGQFRQEISSLGKHFKFDRIYLDACDVGLTLVSEKTGSEATYYVDEEHIENGEITHWTLYPTVETRKKYLQLARTSIVIWND